jgi:hypothetical protein
MHPLKDKSWKLTFETRELYGKDIEELANRLGTEGYIVHSANDDITESDVPEVNADSGLEGKSPSQRLRGSLYRLWESRGKPSGSFDLWYLAQMGKLTDSVKAKIND